MFKVFTSLVNACLESLTKKFWRALTTGFQGRSFQIVSSVVRSFWQGLSRTFVSDCKHAWTRLADTRNLRCRRMQVADNSGSGGGVFVAGSVIVFTRRMEMFHAEYDRYVTEEQR